MGQSLGTVTFSDGLVFNVDEAFNYGQYQKAAVSLSGGTDSTFIAWALAQQLGVENVVACTMRLVDSNGAARREWEPTVAANIARLLGIPGGLTAVSSEFSLIGRGAIVHDDFRRFRRTIVSTHPDVQAFFVGETKRVFAPVLEVTATDALRRQQSNVITPLKNLQKSHVIELYHHFNIQHMLSFTWSCTRRGTVQCGECYCCHERHYAFTKANKPDPTEYAVPHEFIDQTLQDQSLFVNGYR